MSDYADYRVSQARLDRVRERAARQKRAALSVALLLVALVVVLAIASASRGEKAAPPRVVVTWPSPQKYGKREFAATPDANGVANLGEVLLRRGQPFSVELQNATGWDASFVSGETKTEGAKARWQPSKDGETLKIFVRPQVSGWRKLFAWTQSNQELRLTARDAKVLDANRREFKSAKNVWLSQKVASNPDGATVWDQRAIPLAENGQVGRWTIATAFGAKRAANDRGTYLSLLLDADFPADQMTKIARGIAAKVPKASIKWIVNDKSATLRLEFDDSGARGGWVKNAGETEATPLRWWDARLGEDEIRERVAPSLPR